MIHQHMEVAYGVKYLTQINYRKESRIIFLTPVVL